MLGTKLLFMCVCMYIPHTLTYMGSLVAHVYRLMSVHMCNLHVVDSQALHECNLSSLNAHDHARMRNWK